MGREVSGYDVSAMICGGAVCGDGRIMLHLRSHMRVSLLCPQTLCLSCPSSRRERECRFLGKLVVRDRHEGRASTRTYLKREEIRQGLVHAYARDQTSQLHGRRHGASCAACHARVAMGARVDRSLC